MPLASQHASGPAESSQAAPKEEEQLAAMEGSWGVWGVVPMAESFRAAGKKPMGGGGGSDLLGKEGSLAQHILNQR